MIVVLEAYKISVQNNVDSMIGIMMWKDMSVCHLILMTLVGLSVRASSDQNFVSTLSEESKHRSPFAQNIKVRLLTKVLAYQESTCIIN